jgi:hypothetical protein
MSYFAPSFRVIMNIELERRQKESVVVYFKVLYLHLFSLNMPISGFETGSMKLWSESITNLTSTFGNCNLDIDRHRALRSDTGPHQFVLRAIQMAKGYTTQFTLKFLEEILEDV